MAADLTRGQLSLIAGSFLFDRMDEIVVERIVSDQACVVETYGKGQVIYDRTHFRRCLGLILSGRVRVEKPAARGSAMLISVLGQGDCFGASVLFSGRTMFPTLLTAESPTEVLFIPEERIHWAMRRDFSITENYIRYLSDRVWFLNETIANLTAGTVEQRVARFLLERADGEGRITVSMSGLARQLSVSRASLYRALDSLEETGAIHRQGRTIVILDRPALEATS